MGTVNERIEMVISMSSGANPVVFVGTTEEGLPVEVRVDSESYMALGEPQRFIIRVRP